jgi:predicted XRE-type DNA-binding protein
MSKKISGNESRGVFESGSVPNVEEHLIKAQLVFRIDATIKARSLKQVEVAELFGIRQSEVSKMLRGEFREFAVERLLSFLVALHQDVGIVVRPHRHRSSRRAATAR